MIPNNWLLPRIKKINKLLYCFNRRRSSTGSNISDSKLPQATRKPGDKLIEAEKSETGSVSKLYIQVFNLRVE